MNVFEFKSTAVCTEIDLNNIAVHFGINKKFKWMEPLILDEASLKGIIPKPDGKMVYIFHFGSLVFINLSYPEMQDIISYLKGMDRDIGNIAPFKYSEEFRLEIRDGFIHEGSIASNFEVNYNYTTVGKLNGYYIDIISTVLAKSAALENIEIDIDALLDRVEDLIEFLDKGRLDLNDKQLAKMSGKVLRFRYNTISYLMLLDKPDVAWKIEDAEEFFTSHSELFELKGRYETIIKKSETLLGITEVFSGLTHSRRGTRLELAVIILIAIELLLFGIETATSLFSKFF